MELPIGKYLTHNPDEDAEQWRWIDQGSWILNAVQALADETYSLTGLRDDYSRPGILHRANNGSRITEDQPQHVRRDRIARMQLYFLLVLSFTNYPLNRYFYLLLFLTAAFSVRSMCAYTNAYKISKTSDDTKKKTTIGSATLG